MKHAIGKLFQKFQESFLNHGSEYEQALIRIFLTLSVFIYLSYRIIFDEAFQNLKSVYLASIIYLSISLIFALFHISQQPSVQKQAVLVYVYRRYA